MENLFEIVRNYSDKTISEDALRRQIRPVSLSTAPREDRYLAFKKAVLKGMYLFIMKDMPKANQLDSDQLRGLLFNRIRTEITSAGHGFTFSGRCRKSPCHSIIMQFTSDKTDIERITLFAGSYSNIEVTGDDSSTRRVSSMEDKYLGMIFTEMRSSNLTMKQYLASHGLVITSTSNSNKTNYTDLLLNYTTKKFHS